LAKETSPLKRKRTEDDEMNEPPKFHSRPRSKSTHFELVNLADNQKGMSTAFLALIFEKTF